MGNLSNRLDINLQKVFLQKILEIISMVGQWYYGWMVTLIIIYLKNGPIQVFNIYKKYRKMYPDRSILENFLKQSYLSDLFVDYLEINKNNKYQDLIPFTYGV